MGATIQELFLAAAFEGEIDDLKDRVKELETALQAIIDNGLTCGECADKIDIAKKALGFDT